MSDAADPVLCYVDGPWAFFTTQDLAKQWGDDWNDAPYEYNAGRPYDDKRAKREGREPGWRIVKVAWDGDFDEPRGYAANSLYSVEMINSGQVIPWLRHELWREGARGTRDTSLDVWAGTTLRQFVTKIRRGGGRVYFADETDLLDLMASVERL